MRKLTLFASLVVCCSFAANLCAQDGPMPSQPTEHHKWLGQLVGEWNATSEAILAPGQPPLKFEGQESVRVLGGLWTISEYSGEFMGNKFTGVMTLGYDEKQKRYIGTWVDTMHNHMWHYTGTLDESGKILTLEAEGPNMADAGKKAKFRDAIEIKDKDHKVMRSSMQTEDGEWVQFMTVEYRRKK
jgi:hypothetical protein